MNIVPTGSSTRADDAQGMHRRLLHDLERQWLDTWRVMGQEPGEAGDAAGTKARDGHPADEAPPTGCVAGVHVAPDMQAAEPPAGQSSQQRATANASATGLVGTGPVAASPGVHAAQASEGVTPIVGEAEFFDVSGPAGRESVHLPEGPSDDAGAAADRCPGAQAVPGVSASIPGSDGRPPRIGPGGLSAVKIGPVQSAGSVQMGGGGVGDRTADASGRPSDPSQLLAPRGGDRFGGYSAAVPARSVQERMDDPIEWRTSKRNPPLKSHPPGEYGPQRLTLRELSEHEVLASMRDSLLTAAQSQRAAQGLARALMEAGYAKVQVVVNGRPPTGAATSISLEAESPGSGVVPSDHTQETDHGH
jgi:hypothetical protein